MEKHLNPKKIMKSRRALWVGRSIFSFVKMLRRALCKLPADVSEKQAVCFWLDAGSSRKIFAISEVGAEPMIDLQQLSLTPNECT